MYKRILFCGPMVEGKVHGFAVFKSIFAHVSFSRLTVWVDLGFLGIEDFSHPGSLFIPSKASKHHPLDEIAIEHNSIISSVRVRVEHAIANMKAFFVLRHKNRMRIESKLDTAFTICASLANFRLKSLTINR